MTPRTFKLVAPHMYGDDIALWQRTINATFGKWGIDYRVAVDGGYDVATRSATATLLYALGIAQAELTHGVTPDLRIKVRNYRTKLNPAERARFAARVGWRRRLRAKWSGGVKVARPVSKILADSWGYHPPVHDGLDVICPERAPLYAMCDGEVVRVSGSGWWGKGAPSDPALAGKGDGVIVLRCTATAGPYRPGLNIVYGHAEGACVRVGQSVKAGQQIGHAGFANAWHIHLCVNGRTDTLGVGDRDPRPFLDYAVKNG